MKAIVYEQYGTPEELQMKEIPIPDINNEEVLIQAKASSINSWDWDLLTGKPLVYRLFFGLTKPRIKVIGCDIAGTVVKVGNKVKNLKYGDEVMGDISAGKWGAYAEYVVAHEDELIVKPEILSFEEAATIPHTFVLAYQSLFGHHPLKQGDKLLINGAGGGVGTFALQLAKHVGAEVTCVDRAEKLPFLKNLGADQVIDFKKEDFTSNGILYNRIVDVTIQRSLFRYTRSIVPGGSLVVIGGKVKYLLQIAIFGFLISIFNKKKYQLLIHKANKELEQVLPLISQGILKPVVNKIFGLTDTREAFEYYQNGNFVGKIVIQMEK